jgi:hypothetical protein
MHGRRIPEDAGIRPNSELFRLEWPQVQLESSEPMPNGYIRVREGKTQSAERILPLTPRGREALLIFKDGTLAEALGVSWPCLSAIECLS